MKVQIDCSFHDIEVMSDSFKAFTSCLAVMSDLNEALRSRVKYTESDTDDFRAGVQFARDKLFELMDTNVVDLDDLSELSGQLMAMSRPDETNEVA